MATIEKTIARSGFLEINEITHTKVRHRKIGRVTVSKVTYQAVYLGNMGDSVDANVKPCFDRIYGKGAFDLIRDNSTMAGFPDYIWTMEFNSIPVIE